jgi:hypothetical protein
LSVSKGLLTVKTLGGIPPLTPGVFAAVAITPAQGSIIVLISYHLILQNKTRRLLERL